MSFPFVKPRACYIGRRPTSAITGGIGRRSASMTPARPRDERVEPPRPDHRPGQRAPTRRHGQRSRRCSGRLAQRRSRDRRGSRGHRQPRAAPRCRGRRRRRGRAAACRRSPSAPAARSRPRGRPSAPPARRPRPRAASPSRASASVGQRRRDAGAVGPRGATTTSGSAHSSRGDDELGQGERHVVVLVDDGEVDVAGEQQLQRAGRLGRHDRRRRCPGWSSRSVADRAGHEGGRRAGHRRHADRPGHRAGRGGRGRRGPRPARRAPRRRGRPSACPAPVSDDAARRAVDQRRAGLALEHGQLLRHRRRGQPERRAPRRRSLPRRPTSRSSRSRPTSSAAVAIRHKHNLRHTREQSLAESS